MLNSCDYTDFEAAFSGRPSTTDTSSFTALVIKRYVPPSYTQNQHVWLIRAVTALSSGGRWRHLDPSPLSRRGHRSIRQLGQAYSRRTGRRTAVWRPAGWRGGDCDVTTFSVLRPVLEERWAIFITLGSTQFNLILALRTYCLGVFCTISVALLTDFLQILHKE